MKTDDVGQRHEPPRPCATRRTVHGMQQVHLIECGLTLDKLSADMIETRREVTRMLNFGAGDYNTIHGKLELLKARIADADMLAFKAFPTPLG